jgi:hypothetical protein
MGRFRRVAPLVFALLTLGASGSLVLPAAAAARPKGIAPPGNSGVTQYMEDLPTIGGLKATSVIVIPPGGGSGPTAGGYTALPSAVAKKLNRSGSAGQAAAALAEATASPSSSVAPKPAASKPPAAPTSQVLKTLGGSTGAGGLGAFLPVLLIAALIIVSGIGIFQRRRRT